MRAPMSREEVVYRGNTLPFPGHSAACAATRRYGKGGVSIGRLLDNCRTHEISDLTQHWISQSVN